MSTLYIRSPSTITAHDVQTWLAMPWSYAVAIDDDVAGTGSLPLAELAGHLVEARHTVLLLAASDVTLLRVAVPPLSPARLKQALPHLVEEQLMSDPADCVMVLGRMHDGLHTVAVMQRAWLEALAKTLRDAGAHHVVALPAQLCLPITAECVHAAVTGDAPVTDLTLRLSEHAALGLPIQSESATAIAHDVLQTLEALAPEGDLALRVDAASMEIYRDALQSHPLLAQRAALTEDRWQDWIAGTKATSPNLLSALQAGMQRAIDWRAWRRPLALAACLLFVNLIALNLQWWHLKNEAQRLRTAMTEIYRSAYPAEKVIVDPLLQMQQKLATARRMTGQLAADDFVTLAAALGEAINSIAPPNNPESILASIEYRDRALLVKFKADRDISMSGIKAALAKRNLSLSKTDTAAWQIGVAK